MIASLLLRLTIAVLISGIWSAGMIQVQTLSVRAEVTHAEPVLVDESGVLRLLDVGSGEERWRLGERGSLSAAVAGARAVIFASTTRPGARETVVFAVDQESHPEEIARLSGTALVKAVSPAGDQLLFLRYEADRSLPAGPSGLARIALPDRWRLGPPPSTVDRDLGGGILQAAAPNSGDAESYHLDVRVAQSGEIEQADLVIGTFNEADRPAWSRVSLPLTGGPYSLLLTADGTRLYVVEYGGQAVHAVDLAQRKVTVSSSFGNVRDKRPACAATLTPEGDQLMLLGPAERSSTDVLVLDTGTITPVTHHTVGQALVCLAVSPDGQRLSVLSGEDGCMLVTLDAESFAESSRVSTHEPDCGYLRMVVPGA